MRIATAALQAYVTQNDTVVVIDLYTFSLVNGSVLRYADYPLAVLNVPKVAFPDPNSLNTGASGTFAFNRGPRFGRTKVTNKVGVEPAEIEIDCFPSPAGSAETEDLIGTITWQTFANLGGFDGATIEIDRLYLPSSGSTLGAGDGFTGPLNFTLGSIVWFYGRTADIEVGRSKINFKVKSFINLLQQQQLPRRLFQAGCNHIFGDPMCGFNRVAGQNALGTPVGGTAQITFSAQVGSNQSKIVAASPPAALFMQGTIIGTTGQNAGIKCGIANVSGTDIFLIKPMIFPVTVGDGFAIQAGCDHTVPTCDGTFNNLARYGGYPHIPPPELSI